MGGLVAVVVAACLVGVMPGVAFAHVVVSPGTATQGGYAALTFRVPNERDDASTTGIEVQFPTDFPLASVSVKPDPRYRYEITKTKPARPVEAHGASVTEVVGKITWTAADPESAIKPGEYDEFSVSVGPLPETDLLVFKTLQRYGDGEVVRWIQEPAAAGAEEPERPAPVLRLLPKGSDDTQGNPAAQPSTGTGEVALDASSAPASGSDTGVAWAVGLSAAALVISLACAATLVARRRRAP
ncbi:YcnI family protein [Nonomuraea jiangxiensis]|uniref:YcnI family copper-binding membrane protein n=1 Tax=Nonomuraea jiangxiensis TaxID=633440 RepID=UPI000B869250|nr:YcnI family protein [Nonomuraea jiangxiensis]